MSTEAAIIAPDSPINRLLDSIPYQHSAEIRAQALILSDSGLTPVQIGKQLGVPKPTIYYWIESASKAQTLDKSLDLATRFEKAAELFIELAVKKARKAGFNHLMTGAGIAIDKMQLLRGLPTSIHENVERQELVCILESALSAGLDDAIDVTPKPLDIVDSHG